MTSGGLQNSCLCIIVYLRPIDFSLDLDACLIGLGGCWCNFVYHFPIVWGYIGWSIAQLEMINILLVVRLFQAQWAHHKVLIRCGNKAIVSVLRSGRTKDPYLGAYARNIWYDSALADIHIQYVYVGGVNNGVSDLLSCWTGGSKMFLRCLFFQNPISIPVTVHFL